MVGLMGRRVKVNAILWLRFGAAAAVLPPDVTRIHMDFAKRINSGHMGPRKFWREYLPQLKYHNPGIPMIVNRTTEQDRPATMTVYFRREPEPAAGTTAGSAGGPAAAAAAALRLSSSNFNMSKAPEPRPDERIAKIDMRSRHSSQILELLLEATRALIVEPSPAEQEQIDKFNAERLELAGMRKESGRLKKITDTDRPFKARAQTESKARGRHKALVVDA